MGKKKPIYAESATDRDIAAHCLEQALSSFGERDTKRAIWYASRAIAHLSVPKEIKLNSKE